VPQLRLLHDVAGVEYSDASFGNESRSGVPFMFLLRDIMQARGGAAVYCDEESSQLRWFLCRICVCRVYACVLWLRSICGCTLCVCLLPTTTAPATAVRHDVPGAWCVT
jgi:hypothetical protein